MNDFITKYIIPPMFSTVIVTVLFTIFLSSIDMLHRFSIYKVVLFSMLGAGISSIHRYYKDKGEK